MARPVIAPRSFFTEGITRMHRVHTFMKPMLDALDLRTELDAMKIEGTGALPSAFAVTDFAAASIATAAAGIAALRARRSGDPPPAISVDRRLSAWWVQLSIRPLGWRLPPPWDAIAGDYACRDGWIRLHTNAPHHRAAAESVLGRHADKSGMADAVRRWDKTALESAVVEAGGCAAEMRSIAEWQRHPQGRAVADEPLVDVEAHEGADPARWPLEPGRPLDGVRVLDLTRVLAGPVATRFLAGYGAQVLRIDPPHWDEPSVVPEVNPGKRSARLDLRTDAGRATLQRLLVDADVFVHGYRPGALEALGLGTAARRAMNPALVDVGLDAYGWHGPWAGRRGFDSLVQMSSGIADAGMGWRSTDRPVPLPGQALDHVTGYLMAAAVLRGLLMRVETGATLSARLSLARTAALLIAQPRADDARALDDETPDDREPAIERTSWGDAQRLRPPVRIDGTPMHWDLPAHALGADEPVWLTGSSGR
jgi:crotonobetainyl-CoA:carnitine CoA-transferase CaiB-like acyl-CoA transferase